MAFKKLASEFFGTFGLIFCGCGAMTINEVTNNSITHVGVAITWGIIVMSMIYAFGETSGAHFNPAVTIAFTIANKFELKNVFPYLTSQILGSLFAIVILYVLFPESETLGSTIPIANFPAHKTFILEFILTFILMFVILKVSTGSKELGTMSAIAIGGIVLLEAMFAGPITKASMNPFRSIAPAVISGNYHQLWVYIFAPIFGAITAVYANKISS